MNKHAGRTDSLYLLSGERVSSVDHHSPLSAYLYSFPSW